MNSSATRTGRRGRGRAGDRQDADSPVALARNADQATQKALVAVAAGRCEFPGCGTFLYEHPLTKDRGNFGENAHIVAFKRAGPRGDGERPQDINGIENLMLLCQGCHKLVDDNPVRYHGDLLVAAKRDHEARMRMLTGLGPELRTNVLVVKGRIGERVVEIGRQEVADALLPRYPASTAYHEIDLSGLGDEAGEGYYELAARRIAEQVAAMQRPNAFDGVQHVSVFALAPIPLLVILGDALSNTVPTDFYQSHRDKPERWTWYAQGEPATYRVDQVKRGADPGKVAVLLSLSGTIVSSSLPPGIDDDFSVYDLTLNEAIPNPGFLRTRADLESFRAAYRLLLAQIVRDHGGVDAIHLFPAVPAPVAVSLGYDLLPKVHPALIVHDFDKRVGGFTERAKVNDYE